MSVYVCLCLSAPVHAAFFFKALVIGAETFLSAIMASLHMTGIQAFAENDWNMLKAELARPVLNKTVMNRSVDVTKDQNVRGGNHGHVQIIHSKM